MDAGVAAAGLHVALERSLLGVVEHVARSREPDDDVVLGEVCVGELRRILGRVDGEPVLRTERLDRRDALRDRVMTERCRLREHEHLLQRRRSARGAGAERADQQRSEQPKGRSPSKTHALLLFRLAGPEATRVLAKSEQIDALSGT